jgi:hypothetical protein
MASQRRYFGNIRRRESRRYQARYRAPNGRLLSAPHTFARKADAARWLMLKEAEIHRGEWVDPDHAGISFGNYARQWLEDRVLKVRTRELYEGLLRNHLYPAFGNLGLPDIDEAAVRRWRKERLDSGRIAPRKFGPVTVAKAYRLLHVILETAADDHLIRRNPCRIKGAGKEESAEREVVSLPVVFAVADAVPVRFRALVLLATFGSLRWGELVGLRRENVDLDACVVRVIETTAELDRGGLMPETPKSKAGRRTVAFPAELVPELRWHLDRFAAPGERASSSSARRQQAYGVPTSGRSGTPLPRAPASPDCTSTTSATSAGPWQLQPGRASRNSWPGSGIRAPGPR